MKLHSGDVIQFGVSAWRDEYDRGYSCGPLLGQPDERTELLFLKMQIAHGGISSVEAEAAVLALVTIENIKDLLLRICAPDKTKRVVTGACTWSRIWGPPVYACATYNADANITRDLALSWVHLHDRDDTEHLAALPLNALRERVEATPLDTHVLVSSELKLLRDKDAVHTHLDVFPPLKITVRGARIDFIGEHTLTREQVLKVLDTPGNTLLEAFEAAAVADEDWRAVESHALETLKAKEQGAPCYEKWVNSRAHLLFIEQHAPYHVRRLPNGGVLLATHPYRTLWRLWADALDLLGIRTEAGRPT